MVLNPVALPEPCLLRCVQVPSRCRSVKPPQQDEGIQLGKGVDHRDPPVCGRIIAVPLLLPDRH